jgi:hypothetical protein
MVPVIVLAPSILVGFDLPHHANDKVRMGVYITCPLLDEIFMLTILGVIMSISSALIQGRLLT